MFPTVFANIMAIMFTVDRGFETKDYKATYHKGVSTKSWLDNVSNCSDMCTVDCVGLVQNRQYNNLIEMQRVLNVIYM